ncbi:hypothetical protein KFL_014320010, partial [Klebsormidium nitens]
GGQGAAYDVATWMKLYNGSSTKKHNVGKVLRIPKTSMSIVGFTQIWNAFKFLARDDHEGMGFKERFMVVFPTPILLPFKDIGKVPQLPRGLRISQPANENEEFDYDNNPLRGSLLHQLLETFLRIGEDHGNKSRVWLFTEEATEEAGKAHDAANDVIWDHWKEGDEPGGATTSKERPQTHRVALAFAVVEHALDQLLQEDESTRPYGVVGLDCYRGAEALCAYIKQTKEILLADPVEQDLPLTGEDALNGEPKAGSTFSALDVNALNKAAKVKRLKTCQYWPCPLVFQLPFRYKISKYSSYAFSFGTDFEESIRNWGGWGQPLADKTSPINMPDDDTVQLIDRLGKYKVGYTEYCSAFKQQLVLQRSKGADPSSSEPANLETGVETDVGLDPLGGANLALRTPGTKTGSPAANATKQAEAHGIASPQGLALIKQATNAASSGLTEAEDGDGLRPALENALKLTAGVEKAAKAAAYMRSINSPGADSATATANLASTLAQKSLMGVVEVVRSRGSTATENAINAAEDAQLAASALLAAGQVRPPPPSKQAARPEAVDAIEALTRFAQGLGADPQSLLIALQGALPQTGGSVLLAPPSGTVNHPLPPSQPTANFIVDAETHQDRLGTAQDAKDSQKRLMDSLAGAAITGKAALEEATESPAKGKKRLRKAEGTGQAETRATKAATADANKPKTRARGVRQSSKPQI